MRVGYIVNLSFKNLISHRMRTILTVGGVSISVGFIIFLVSLGLGLQKLSTNQIANLDALQVIDVSLGKSNLLTISDAVLEKFKNLGEVQQVEPQVSLATNFSIEGSSSEGVLYGASQEMLKLGDIKPSSGKTYSSDNAKEAIVNSAVKNSAKNDVLGKEIKVTYTLKPSMLTQGQAAKTVTDTYKIVGVINDSNASYVYVPLETIKEQGLANYTGAKIKMSGKDKVDAARLKIENMGFRTTSIKETVDQINQFFNIFQMILLSFGAIAVIVSCMGMFNTLTISLLEKTREVGFMKALGTTRRDVYRLFIVESLLIGFIGAFVGILSGTLLGTALNLSITSLARATGNQPVSLFYTPFTLILEVLVVSMLISFLTGFYPARRASRINALDALRYE